MQYFSEQLGLFKEHLIWTQDDFSVNANIKTMEQWIIIINLSLNNKAIIISRHFRKNYNILWEHIVFTFSRRKFDIFPPSGSPPLLNWISTYLPYKESSSQCKIPFTEWSRYHSMKTSFINASKNDMHFQKRCSFFFYIRLFKNWFFKGSYLKEKWRYLCSLLCNALLDVPEYIVHFHQFHN